MKQIWPDYSYSPATNVLTLTGLNIDRDQLLLVTAADRGRIMYNFADSSVTASAFTSGANTALTLVATTAGLTTTAALVIYFDDQATSSTVTGTVELGPTSLNALESITVTMGQVTVTGGLTDVQLRASAVTVGGTVTVGNSLTISSLPAISGTVTANLSQIAFTNTEGGIASDDGGEEPNLGIQLGYYDGDYKTVKPSQPLPISGTVTIGNSVTISSLPPLAAGTANIGVVTIGNIRRAGDNAISQLSTQAGSNYLLTVVMPGTSQIGSVTASISNSVTIGSLPAISGTVTANLSISSTVITSGSFTSLASATLVPGNTARKMATVYNLGAGQLFVNAGATATTLGGGFMVALSSGDFYECDYTTTTLSAIFATAGTASWMSH
jgi:hypothetical protein